MTFALFAIVLVFAAGLYYLLAPLVGASELTHSPADSLEDLRYRKEEVLDSLKDFELDHKMKKISDDDYRIMYQETFTEGTRILKEMDERKIAGKKDSEKTADKTAKAPASSSVTGKKAKFCVHCGESLVEGAKFCAQCGGKVG